MLNDNERLKKIIITLAKSAGVFFILAIVCFFSLRNYVLHKVLDKVAVKFHNDYASEFVVGTASFKGITGVEIQQIAIIPIGKDTLFHVDTLQTSIRFWYAFLLDFRIKELVIKDGFINLVKNNEGRNFDSFLKHKKQDSALNDNTENEKKSNYAKTAYHLISKILAQIPNEVLVEKFSVKITDDEKSENFNLEHFILHDEQIESSIKVNTNTFDQHWKINGFASPQKKTLNIEFYNLDTGKVRLPYIDERFHLVAGFDSVKLTIASVEMDGDELHIVGATSITQLLINHPKISKKDVVVERAEANFSYTLGSNFVSLDSTTTVAFNKVQFHPYISFQNSPDTVFRFAVKIEKTTSQDFIHSLPEGLFTHFKGMQAEGSFTYSLNFLYNQNNPDEVVFDVDLKKENLKILKYGEANLSKLNDEFVYVPIDKGKPQRPVLVGLDNAYYTPADQISPYLKKCVLTSEDPSFFYHRGFIDEAFRQSIIKNIRTRKFSRGASTISMQLVKNVFLTREKTLSRKLEEILLVYILENNHLSTKDRMFEVYLNIIEWGPDVYGIGEAAQYYFKKKPSALTLKECLFLTTIIPRPKGFMWRFDKDGNPRDFVEKQYHFLSDLMIRRNLLLPEDTMGLNQKLLINGAAKKLIIKNDSNVTDTILKPEEELF
ncbi:MAG: biosynthetic peptidoglycan transglycosylase [Bacteroidota bacterium]